MGMPNNPKSACVANGVPRLHNDSYWCCYRWILIVGNAVFLAILFPFSLIIIHSVTGMKVKWIVMGHAVIAFIIIGISYFVYLKRVHQLLYGAVSEIDNTEKTALNNGSY